MSYFDSIFEADIPDEWRWERIRIWRDKLLTETDFRMVSDTPFDKEQWAQYRQALRDLPTTQSNPSKIVFPTAPDA